MKYMSVIDTILNNKYLLKDILATYAGQLKELKALHQVNCPEREAKEKSCRKYYWLCLDLAEIEFLLHELEEEHARL
jgi:hypothetical protein